MLMLQRVGSSWHGGTNAEIWCSEHRWVHICDCRCAVQEGCVHARPLLCKAAYLWECKSITSASPDAAVQLMRDGSDLQQWQRSSGVIELLCVAFTLTTETLLSVPVVQGHLTCMLLRVEASKFVAVFLTDGARNVSGELRSLSYINVVIPYW